MANSKERIDINLDLEEAAENAGGYVTPIYELSDEEQKEFKKEIKKITQERIKNGLIKRK